MLLMEAAKYEVEYLEKVRKAEVWLQHKAAPLFKQCSEAISSETAEVCHTLERHAVTLEPLGALLANMAALVAPHKVASWMSAQVEVAVQFEAMKRQSGPKWDAALQKDLEAEFGGEFRLFYEILALRWLRVEVYDALACIAAKLEGLDRSELEGIRAAGRLLRASSLQVKAGDERIRNFLRVKEIEKQYAPPGVTLLNGTRRLIGEFQVTNADGSPCLIFVLDDLIVLATEPAGLDRGVFELCCCFVFFVPLAHLPPYSTRWGVER
jgi:hypothetical protein